MIAAKHLMIACTLAALPAGAALAASGSSPHNGTWSVRMVTDSGLCESTYNYSIAIENGNVRYLLAPGDSPTTVKGQVQPNGLVELNIYRSIAKVDANGQLRGSSGSGTWKLNMLGCSGRWTAQKRSSVVQS
ncbi:hypothetical protein [Microvirga puerhi]|uniref:Uncharacterized protein n=1 Tax=Microvirga puerhi TaxID=2876078 RepID=A0ABS7VML8_9HYPH|nr:hypothetical protein [Microvirga puerhi]MBZ6076335.1 hypothetical protein [Microvirga puerhi]